MMEATPLIILSTLRNVRADVMSILGHRRTAERREIVVNLLWCGFDAQDKRVYVLPNARTTTDEREVFLRWCKHFQSLHQVAA